MGETGTCDQKWSENGGWIRRAPADARAQACARRQHFPASGQRSRFSQRQKGPKRSFKGRVWSRGLRPGVVGCDEADGAFKWTSSSEPPRHVTGTGERATASDSTRGTRPAAVALSQLWRPTGALLPPWWQIFGQERRKSGPITITLAFLVGRARKPCQSGGPGTPRNTAANLVPPSFFCQSRGPEGPTYAANGQREAYSVQHRGGDGAVVEGVLDAVIGTEKAPLVRTHLTQVKGCQRQAPCGRRDGEEGEVKGGKQKVGAFKEKYNNNKTPKMALRTLA